MKCVTRQGHTGCYAKAFLLRIRLSRYVSKRIAERLKQPAGSSRLTNASPSWPVPVVGVTYRRLLLGIPYCKAMIKQIDRVIGDLAKQVAHFKRGAGNPICIGIVGINHAAAYTSYEGERAWPTDGTARYRHPVQEASQAESRLLIQARPSFDEFLILRFRASNQAPYAFEWLDLAATSLDYGAILTRISREYNRRFRNGNGGDTQSV